MYSYWKRQQIERRKNLWKNFFIGIVIAIAFLIVMAIGGGTFPY